MTAQNKLVAEVKDRLNGEWYFTTEMDNDLTALCDEVERLEAKLSAAERKCKAIDDLAKLIEESCE